MSWDSENVFIASVAAVLVTLIITVCAYNLADLAHMEKMAEKGYIQKLEGNHRLWVKAEPK